MSVSSRHAASRRAARAAHRPSTALFPSTGAARRQPRLDCPAGRSAPTAAATAASVSNAPQENLWSGWLGLVDDWDLRWERKGGCTPPDFMFPIHKFCRSNNDDVFRNIESKG